MYKFLSFLFLGITLFCFTGCDDNEANSIPPIEGYEFESSEITVSADTHVFTLPVSCVYEYVNPMWTIWTIGEYDSTVNGLPDWRYEGGAYIVEDNKVTYKWVTAERIVTANRKCPSLKLTLETNLSTEKRGCRILIDNKYKESGIEHWYTGCIDIWQEGKGANAGDDSDQPVHVSVRYKGQIYSSEASFDENGKYIFENDDMSELMERLSSRNDIETFVLEDGIVDFYDSEDIDSNQGLKKILKAVESPDNSESENTLFQGRSRSSDNPFANMPENDIAGCILHDDTDFSDRFIYCGMTNIWASHDYNYLTTQNMNDKISSIAVIYRGTYPTHCAVLTVWEDSHYNNGDNDRTKHRMNFVATYNQTQLKWPNLKNIPCLHSGDSWNDRISSISFHVGNYEDYPKIY